MMGSGRSWEREQEEESSGCFRRRFLGLKRNQVIDCSLSRSEIEDSDFSEELFEINLKEPSVLDTIREDCESTVFSLDIHNCNDNDDDEDDDDDIVYVAVSNNDEHSSPSMEALSWALKHAVTPSATVVRLLHVFPQVKLIPSPCN